MADSFYGKEVFMKKKAMAWLLAAALVFSAVPVHAETVPETPTAENVSEEAGSGEETSVSGNSSGDDGSDSTGEPDNPSGDDTGNTSVSGNSSDDTGTEEDFVPVVRIGDVEYRTLAEALEHVPSDGSETAVTLLADQEAPGFTPAPGVNLVLDLNSHALTINSAEDTESGIELVAGARAVIKNGTVLAGEAPILIRSFGELTLEDVTLDASGSQSCGCVIQSKSGTCDVLGTTSIIAQEGQTALEICQTSAEGAAVKINTAGKINGSIGFIYEEEAPQEVTSATLIVENMHFTGSFAVDTDNFGSDQISISGGLYSKEFPAEYLGEGLELIANTDAETSADYPFAVDKIYRFMINNSTSGQKFATLQEAVDAVAQSSSYSKYIYMIGDAEGAGVALPENLRLYLYLQDHTYTITDEAGQEGPAGFTVPTGSYLYVGNGRIVSESSSPEPVFCSRSSNGLSFYNISVDASASGTDSVIEMYAGTVSLGGYNDGLIFEAPEGKKAINLIYGDEESYLITSSYGYMGASISSNYITVKGALGYERGEAAAEDENWTNHARYTISRGLYDVTFPEGLAPWQESCAFNITGGVFTDEIPAECYDQGNYRVIANTDEATAEKYPYTLERIAWVAQVGDTKYESLKEAMDVVPLDGTETTVKLLTNVTGNGLIFKSGMNVILEGLPDININTANVPEGEKIEGVIIEKGATVTMNRTYIRSYTADAIIINYGTLNMNSATLYASNAACSTAVRVYDGTVNITGTSTYGNISASGKNALDLVYTDETEAIKVNVDSSYSGYVYGYVNIRTESDDPDWQDKVSLAIAGGRWDGLYRDEIADGADIRITGGVFKNVIPEKYIAENYMAAENTVSSTKRTYPYTVAAMPLICKNETTGAEFADLQKAIDMAANGDTIIMTGQAVCTEKGLVIPEDKEITIDLGTTQNAIMIFVTAAPEKNLRVYGKLTLKSSAIETYGSGAPNYLGTASNCDDAGAEGTALVDVFGSGSFVLQSGWLYANGTRTTRPFGGVTAVHTHDEAAFTLTGRENTSRTVIRTMQSAIVADDNSVVNMDYGMAWGMVDTRPVVVLNDSAVMNLSGGYIRSGGTTTTVTDEEGNSSTVTIGGQPGVEVNDEAKLLMTGGQIRSELAESAVVTNGNGKAVISAGYLSNVVPYEQCADGYIPKEEGVDSGYEFFYYTVAKEVHAEVVAASVNFSGLIGLNYYISVPDLFMSDEEAYIQYEMNGEVTKILLSEAEKTKRAGKEVIKVEVPVVPRMIHDEITLKICGGDDYALKLRTSTGIDVTEGFVYSVAAYCEDIKVQSTNEKMIALADALEQYGAYVQVYLDYKADEANTVSDFSDVNAETMQSFNGSTEGSLEGLTFAALSFIFKEDSRIRYKFTVAEGHDISEYTFTHNGETLTPSKQGKKYYIEIGDIKARQLGDNFGLTATDSVGNSMEMSYGPFAYAYLLFRSSGSEAARNAACALYRYGTAAREYFGA